MISVIELKKYIAGTGVFGIVVGKLCHEKKPCLIILLVVDENSKVDFYCIILPLSLAVCLRMKSSEKSPLHVKKIA